jgi:hypothetical protein
MQWQIILGSISGDMFQTTDFLHEQMNIKTNEEWRIEKLVSFFQTDCTLSIIEVNFLFTHQEKNVPPLPKTMSTYCDFLFTVDVGWGDLQVMTT